MGYDNEHDVGCSRDRVRIGVGLGPELGLEDADRNVPRRPEDQVPHVRREHGRRRVMIEINDGSTVREIAAVWVRLWARRNHVFARRRCLDSALFHSPEGLA